LRLNTETMEEYWERTRDNIKIARSTKYFSPANSRAILDNIPYRQMLEFWSRSGYALRYSGALSADAYHLLIKGEGIYCSIGSKLQKKKLRILYECVPIAYLIEKAGGKSSNGETSLLDVIVDGYYQKSNIIVGSRDEVERMQRFTAADKKARRDASPEKRRKSPEKKYRQVPSNY